MCMSRGGENVLEIPDWKIEISYAGREDKILKVELRIHSEVGSKTSGFFCVRTFNLMNGPQLPLVTPE